MLVDKRRGADTSHHTLAVRVAEVVVCAALALVPLLWRSRLGAGRIPADDAWAYERIYRTFHRTGEVQMIDWNDINLVGMLPVTRLWVALFGYGPYQVYLLGAAMGFAGLLALRSILVTLESKTILFLLVSFGIFSGFVNTSGTYMADLFALAGSLWSVAAALHAVTSSTHRAQVAWVLASACFACFAFSVRQQTVVAAGVTALVLYLARRSGKAMWLVFAGSFAVFAAALYVWRAGLPDGGTTIVVLRPREIAGAVIVFVLTMALALLPLVIAKSAHHDTAFVSARLVASLVAAALAAALPLDDHFDDAGSLITRLFDVGLVGRAVAAVVLANILITVLLALRRVSFAGRPVVGALALGCAVSVLAEVAAIGLGSNYFARYSLFTLAIAMAVLSIVLVPVERRGSMRAGWATLAVVGFASLWVLDGKLAPTKAIADAAAAAECAGIPAARFDGGFEWMGRNSVGVVVSRYHEAPIIDDGLPFTFQQRIFPDMPRDGVALDAIPDDLDEGLVVSGPYESSGLLPGNDAVRWLVVLPEFAVPLEECS